MKILDFQKDPKVVCVVGSLRNKALQIFKAMPAPSKLNEDWKYTSVKGVLESTFISTPKVKSIRFNEYPLVRNCIHIVLKDGQVFLHKNAEYSDLIIKKISLDSEAALKILKRFFKSTKSYNSSVWSNYVSKEVWS